MAKEYLKATDLENAEEVKKKKEKEKIDGFIEKGKKVAEMSEAQRKELRDEIVVFLFEKYGNRTVRKENQEKIKQAEVYDYYKYMKVIESAIRTYDISKNDNLYAYVLSLLERRKSDYMSIEEKDQQLWDYYRIIKNLEKSRGYLDRDTFTYEKLSKDEIVKLCDSLRCSEDKLKKIISGGFQKSRATTSLYAMNEDGLEIEPRREEALKDSSAEEAEADFLERLALFERFVYIAKKVLDSEKKAEIKKLPQYQMINTNIVLIMHYNPDEFYEHINKGYKEYLFKDISREYTDTTIVRYIFFKEQPEIDSRNDEFKKRTSAFSQTVRAKYKEYNRNYNALYGVG